MVLFANLEKLLRNAFDSVGAGVDERRGEGLYGRPLLGLAPRPPLQDKAFVYISSVDAFWAPARGAPGKDFVCMTRH
jgi:hypothetical protein